MALIETFCDRAHDCTMQMRPHQRGLHSHSSRMFRKFQSEFNQTFRFTERETRVLCDVALGGKDGIRGQRRIAGKSSCPRFQCRCRCLFGASIYDIRPEGGGGSRNTPNMRTNNIEFADRYWGEVRKLPKLCGCHIWKASIPLRHTCMASPLLSPCELD